MDLAQLVSRYGRPSTLTPTPTTTSSSQTTNTPNLVPAPNPSVGSKEGILSLPQPSSIPTNLVGSNSVSATSEPNSKGGEKDNRKRSFQKAFGDEAAKEDASNTKRRKDNNRKNFVDKGQGSGSGGSDRKFSKGGRDGNFSCGGYTGAAAHAYQKLLSTKLDTPADVEAWIEERRRHFPTRALVQQKEAEKKAKIAERSATKRTPFSRSSSSSSSSSSSRPSSASSSDKPLNPFALLPLIDAGNGKSAMVQEIDEETKEAATILGPALSSDLASLLSTASLPTLHDFSSSPSEDLPIEEPIEKREDDATNNNNNEEEEDNEDNDPEGNKQKRQKVCRYFLQKGSCRFGSRCSYSHGPEGPSNTIKINRPAPRVIKRPPTLLEKLVADKEAKEKDALLQCLQFIVDQRFLEIEPAEPLDLETDPDADSHSGSESEVGSSSKS